MSFLWPVIFFGLQLFSRCKMIHWVSAWTTYMEGINGVKGGQIKREYPDGFGNWMILKILHNSRLIEDWRYSGHSKMLDQIIFNWDLPSRNLKLLHFENSGWLYFPKIPYQWNIINMQNGTPRYIRSSPCSQGSVGVFLFDACDNAIPRPVVLLETMWDLQVHLAWLLA